MTPPVTPAATILSRPLPVILLDTCVLLDIIRAPARENLGVPAVRAAVALRRGLEPTTLKCHLVLSHLVDAEFTFNAPVVRNDVAKAVMTSERVLGSAAEIGTGASGSGLPTTLPQDLEQLSKELIGKATSIPLDHTSLEKAFQRVVDKRRPSRTGQIKDAYILEQYLALLRDLRKAKFVERCFFVSSNVDDFAEGPGRAGIHPDLQGEFSAVSLEYFVSLTAAVGSGGI